MGAGVETYVQVPPNSSGAKVRNLQIDVMQPDGTTSTVVLQCTNIVDAEGRQVFPAVNAERDSLLRSILKELQAMRRMMGIQSGCAWDALGDAMPDDITG